MTELSSPCGVVVLWTSGYVHDQPENEMTNSIRSLRSVLRVSLVLLIGLCMTHPLISTPLSAQITAANIGMEGRSERLEFPRPSHRRGRQPQHDHLGSVSPTGFLGVPSRSSPKSTIQREELRRRSPRCRDRGCVGLQLLRCRGAPRVSVGIQTVLTLAEPLYRTGGGLPRSAQATGVGPEGRLRPVWVVRWELMSLPIAIPVQHETKSVDVGGTIGMGIDFGTGSTKLVLDVRYTRMMSEFDEAPYDEVYSRKHNALSFQAGISLSPSAWARVATRRSLADPPEQSIVIVERITQENIAARGGDLSVYDIIRLEDRRG